MNIQRLKCFTAAIVKTETAHARSGFHADTLQLFSLLSRSHKDDHQ
jgi:hypothetical protein